VVRNWFRCALLEEEEYFGRDELVGKDVYDAKAKKIGTVADIGYSKEGKIALILRPGTISNVKKLSDKDLVLSHLAGERFQTILFDRISEIGDIILLKADSVAEVRREPVAIADKVANFVTWLVLSVGVSVCWKALNLRVDFSR